MRLGSYFETGLEATLTNMETASNMSFGSPPHPVMAKLPPDEDDGHYMHDCQYTVATPGMTINYSLGALESERDAVVADRKGTVVINVDNEAPGEGPSLEHRSELSLNYGQYEQYKAWLRAQLTRYLQCELPASISPLDVGDIPWWRDAETEEGLPLVAHDIVLFFADRNADSSPREQCIVAYKQTGDGWVATDALKSVLAAGKNPFTQAPLDRQRTRLHHVHSVVKRKTGADMVRYLQTSLPPSIQAVDAGGLPEWSSGETENGLLMPMAAGDIVLFFADRTGNTERMHDDQGIVAYTMEAGSGVYKATSALTNTLATKQNPFTRAPLQANDIRLRRVVVSPNEEGGGAGGGPASKRIRLERRQRRQSRRRRAGRGRASTHSRR